MSPSGSDYWPPGGEDHLIDALAYDHHYDGMQVDMPALLDDPRLGKVAIVSSFGADSIVLLHYIAQMRTDWPVLFLETGKHFQETLDYVRQVAEITGLSVKHVRPDLVHLAEDDPDGNLWSMSADYCCHIRKTFPLQDALAAFDTWISGRKRFQSATRHALPLIERDGAHLKLNPFAHWSSSDIKNYIEKYDLPRHPLVERGYPSIGCAPCTKSVKPGEDERAGRWAHVPDKIECGIHLGPDGKFRRG